MERQFRAAVGEARDGGQTVLLSSHQLAEVEEVDYAVDGQLLAAVMTVPVASGLLLTGVLIGAGTPVSGALIHGSGTALVGAVFVAVAALAAKVLRLGRRRPAQLLRCSR